MNTNMCCLLQECFQRAGNTRRSRAGASAPSFPTVLNILRHSQHLHELERDNTRSVGDQSPAEAAGGCQAGYPQAFKCY